MPSQASVVSVVLAPDRLRFETARRGWSHADLARAAGVSAPTITTAMSGRPISAETLRKIALALSVSPPLAGIDELLPARLA